MVTVNTDLGTLRESARRIRVEKTGSLIDTNIQNALQNITAGSGISAPTIVTAGSTYTIQPTDSRILVNKSSGSVTSVVAPLAASMSSLYPVLIKDAKGDAVANNITITFTGGELCDGLSQIVISTAYGWVEINPTPGGGSWFQSE